MYAYLPLCASVCPFPIIPGEFLASQLMPILVSLPDPEKETGVFHPYCGMFRLKCLLYLQPLTLAIAIDR